MRAQLAAAAAAIMLIAGLTSCSSEPTAEPAASAAAAPAELTETAAPLVAETPEATTAPATPEAAFLEAVRGALRDDTQIPNATDEQLLAAAADACEQLATGTAPEQVRVIENEQPDGAEYYIDSLIIARSAAKHLCA